MAAFGVVCQCDHSNQNLMVSNMVFLGCITFALLLAYLMPVSGVCELKKLTHHNH